MKDNVYCIGIDLGQQSSFWVVKDGEGRIHQRMKIANDRASIEAALKPFLCQPCKTVMEATTNYYWMYQLLKGLGCEVVLAHPLKTRAIASAKIKNDRLDATILADLLRADLIPQSYIPSEEIRALREITRQHIRLVQARTRIKIQCRTLLVKLNLRPSERFSDLFGKKGIEWLGKTLLPEPFELQKKQCLDQIQYYNRLIEEVDRGIEKMLPAFPESKRLLEIPGIAALAAAVLIAEIGPIHRFPSPKQLVGYAGIAPGLYESSQTSHSRGITHEGNRFLRWILCEIVQNHIRSTGPLRHFYLRLKERKGHGKAVIAAARKFLIYIYWTLKGKTHSFVFAG